MRRLTLILSLAALMALLVSAAAFAAPRLSATGNLAFRTAIGENADGDYQLLGNWRTRANLQLDAGSGNLTARVIYRIRTANFKHFHDTSISDWNNDLLDAWVNFRGSLIPGTPSANLRVGRWAVNVNRWIGNFDRRQALYLTDFTLGPVTTNLYHGWESANRTLTAVTGKGSIDIVNLEGAVVFFKDIGAVADHEKSSMDWVISGNAKPINGLSVSGAFAQNGLRKRIGTSLVFRPEGTDPASAWKVTGELTTIPNFKVNASAWSTDDEFRPGYKSVVTKEHLDMDRSWTSGSSRAGIEWGDAWIAKGFSVGVNTTQAGLPINASFKTGEIFGANLPISKFVGDSDSGGASATTPNNNPYFGKQMNVIGIDTTFAKVKVDFTYTMIEDQEAVTDVVVSRSVRIDPLGGDVALRGSLRHRDEDLHYAADATWKAPNGLTLGLHYANYDRVLDWNHNNSWENLSEGVNIGKPGKADGFAITAGYSMTF